MPRPLPLRLAATAAASVALAACGASGPAVDRSGEVEVGYGTLPEDRVTGAVTEIDPAATPRSSAGHLAHLIAGRVAGVDVRRTVGGYSVQIRGAGTSGGPREPLFVVDGVELMMPGLPDLDPNDVARITVLKDAGAAAIYGSRGANGVVLITTRRGGQ